MTGSADLIEYLQALCDDVLNEFEESLSVAEIGDAYDRFQQVMEAFYADHVVPFTDQPGRKA